MCQPKLIELSPNKWYSLEDMLLHVFFRALDRKTQEYFFEEFERDKYGHRKFSQD